LALDAIRYLSAFARHSLSSFVRQSRGYGTLADLVARWAERRPDALAVEVDGKRLSYRELLTASHRAAGALEALGARSGDVVGLVGLNSLSYVAALLGGAQRGITLALVHPELSGAPLQQALAAAGARYVLCEATLATTLREGLGLPLATFEPDGAFAAAPALAEFAADRGQRDFALVFTSGTTGLPKACRLPHSRVLAAACLFGAPVFDFSRQDKLLCALPLHHGSPLMLGLGSCLLTGTPLVLTRRFSARDFFRVATDSGATALLYVGDLGRLLLASPQSQYDRAHQLRVAVGNGMAPDVWTRFQTRFGIASIREFYAATESPVGIFNLSGRVGSVGNLPYGWLFGLKLARRTEDGELVRDARGFLQECGTDEPGELMVRARQSGIGVYHGYVDEQASEARLVRGAFKAGDAYFRTFDVLRKDADGFFYFVERGGDSYRFRGENVAVAAVERELQALPGVQDALVTGVELPGYDGRVGLAVLVTETGFDVGLVRRLSERLPKSALPRFVRLVPDLARTHSLKLKRRSWALAGVDPAIVGPELWAWQPADGSYAPLTTEIYADILSGKHRL